MSLTAFRIRFISTVLSFGTATFGGEGAFKGFGASDAGEATRLVDIWVDAGLSIFDSPGTNASMPSETRQRYNANVQPNGRGSVLFPVDPIGGP